MLSKWEHPDPATNERRRGYFETLRAAYSARGIVATDELWPEFWDGMHTESVSGDPEKYRGLDEIARIVANRMAREAYRAQSWGPVN